MNIYIYIYVCNCQFEHQRDILYILVNAATLYRISYVITIIVWYVQILVYVTLQRRKYLILFLIILILTFQNVVFRIL